MKREASVALLANIRRAHAHQQTQRTTRLIIPHLALAKLACVLCSTPPLQLVKSSSDYNFPLFMHLLKQSPSDVSLLEE